MTDKKLIAISKSVVEGNSESTLALVEEALENEYEPMTIVQDGLVVGMNEVGEKFSTGDLFLPDLIIAAECMKLAMEILEPELTAREQVIKSEGVVVIGTVKGDIHEIGKSLVSTMLSANGFRVIDLGVDVSIERFVDTVITEDADILCLSALLTTTMVVQKEIIEDITSKGLREKIKVMVGGAPVSRDWQVEIGADGYSEDAMGAVKVARELVIN